MPAQATKLKVPTLRFPGFSGAWEEKKLGDFATFTKGAPISKDDLNTQGNKKCILYGELYTMYKEIITDVVSSTNYSASESTLSMIDDLLIPSSGETSLDIARVSCIKEAGVVLGGDLNIMRLGKNCFGEFFAYYLTHSKKINIARLAQGNSVVHLYSSHLNELSFNIPSLREQQKIAGFLGMVDGWIENLRVQKETLESYKKGMMQKIFSQEIRFKDLKGKNFPDWIEKKLEEIGRAFSGLSGKSGEDFGEGEPFITYKQIFDSSEIDTMKFALVKIGHNEKQNRAQYGDIFFTTSSETPEEVGYSSVLLNKNVTPYLNSFCFGFRPMSFTMLDPYFAKHLFRSNNYRQQVIKLAQGSTRYNISKNEFLKLVLPIPSNPEQAKIAEFLTSVDNLIEAKQKQITHAEQWKQGLMQGLFV